MRKNRTIESTKVAAANIRANQRANRTGVTIAASAPITGKRSIHVRALLNIICLSSLHKCDQRKHKYCQHCNTTEEANHVSLHSASFNMTYIATNRCHHSSYAVDHPINDVGIEGLDGMGEPKHNITNQPVVELIHIVFMQQYTMRTSQKCTILYKIMNTCKFKSCIQRICPGKPNE